MEDLDSEQRLIPVEVAYATPARQLIIALEVPLGTTAYEAVIQSRITEEFGEIDIDKDPMGVFSKLLDGKGKPLPKDYQMQARDRIEIYRPLIIDPKQARLQRAQAAKESREKDLNKKKVDKKYTEKKNTGNKKTRKMK